MSFKCERDDAVTFKHEQYEGSARVTFVGSLPTKSGIWIGLERDEIEPNESKPEGFDGKCGDLQFFQCTNNRGILVPYESVHVLSKQEASNAEPTESDIKTNENIHFLSIQEATNTAELDTDLNASEDITQNGTHSHEMQALQGTTDSHRKRKESVDAMQLAQKLKQSVKTQRDKRMLQLKAETDKRINQLKQKQEDITSKLKQRGDALKKKEIRESLNVNANKPQQTSITSSISTRTAQLLQQQKLLSQTVSTQRKHFVTEQLRSEENIDIEFDEEQLKNIDIMSNIFTIQTKESLDSLVVDIQELQTRQENCLQNISKSAIWFNKEERHRLNDMSRVMNQVPKYRKKLTAMRQKVHDINGSVTKLKRDIHQLKGKIGIKQ